MPRLASSSHRFPQYISRLPLSLVLWVGTKYALPRIWSLRIPGLRVERNEKRLGLEWCWVLELTVGTTFLNAIDIHR